MLLLAATLSSAVTTKVAAAEDLIHVVSRGETIYSISRFYRVTPEDLMRVNGISDPSRLQTGRRLTIPSNAFPDVNITPSASPQTVPLADYRVVRGDTLFSIARTNGISLSNLLEMNNFSSNHVIRVGDVIKVPRSGLANVSGSTSANASVAVDPNAALLALRWPINPREISYMTGQMGVVVEGEHFEPVRSLTQGRVISAGPWRKFGKVAIIEAAGGYFYMYGGCEILSVSVGDRISPGTELGKLGINAVSERAQLFFMVFRSDTPIDPARAPRAGGNARS
jgi:LysM repeat protein